MGLDDGPAEIQPQTIMVRIAKPGFINLVKGLKNHVLLFGCYSDSIITNTENRLVFSPDNTHFDRIGSIITETPGIVQQVFQDNP